MASTPADTSFLATRQGKLTLAGGATSQNTNPPRVQISAIVMNSSSISQKTLHATIIFVSFGAAYFFVLITLARRGRVFV